MPDDTAAATTTCPECHGAGGYTEVVGTLHCRGLGGPYYPRERWELCRRCDGRGVVPTVKVEPGWTRVELAGSAGDDVVETGDVTDPWGGRAA